MRRDALVTFLAATLLGVVALAGLASMMAQSGRVALESKIALASENAHLRSEVAALQRKLGHGGGMKRAKAVESLSDRMQWAKAELRHIKGSHRQQLRIKEAGIETVPQKMPGEFAPEPVKLQDPSPASGSPASNSVYHPGSEPWVKTFHNGEQLDAMTTPNGDTNPVSLLKPGDYWKDPYDRPFLAAPNPHDPASTLAKTVTGDYASPATVTSP